MVNSGPISDILDRTINFIDGSIYLIELLIWSINFFRREAVQVRRDLTDLQGGERWDGHRDVCGVHGRLQDLRSGGTGVHRWRRATARPHVTRWASPHTIPLQQSIPQSTCCVRMRSWPGHWYHWFGLKVDTNRMYWPISANTAQQTGRDDKNVKVFRPYITIAPNNSLACSHNSPIHSSWTLV